MKRNSADRRAFLKTAGAATAGLAWGGAKCVAADGGRDAGGSELVESISRCVLWEGRTKGPGWFQPQACMVPGPSGAFALMTMAVIGGSDVFGPVHWTHSTDLGRTWSEPQPIPGLGRKPLDDGQEEGVCDVMPEYHAQTDTVLAIGHNVYYRRNVLSNPQGPRWPVYTVRRADGTWLAPQRLPWDDPRTTTIYTCNCSQRVNLPGGKVLIPLTFGPKERTHRDVTTVLCNYDGRRLEIEQAGNALQNTSGRGLLEPSLVLYEDRYYLTIRAEDGRGYVAVSDDGLQWAPQQAWAWDDGEPLAMSTTQQHWLPHSDRLLLVYTRKSAENARVMRWRAPLYMAEVDRATLRLVRASEQIVLPLVGDAVNKPQEVALMGNFHITNASPEESWVTVGENLRANKFNGDLLMARIRWTKPNRLVA